MEILALSERGQQSTFKPVQKEEAINSGICIVHFIDNISGKYLGRHLVDSDNDLYVSINKTAYIRLEEKTFPKDSYEILNFSDGKVDMMKDQAYIIQVDYKQIETDFKLMLEEKKGNDGTQMEQNMFIYFDSDLNIVSSQILTSKENTNGQSINNLNRYLHYSTIKGEKKKAIMIQLHTHPLIEMVLDKMPTSSGSNIISKEKHNSPGTSEDDYNFAINNKMLTVAIAKYQGEQNIFGGVIPSKVKVYYVKQTAQNWKTVNTYQKGNPSKPVDISLEEILKNPLLFFDDLIALTQIT